MRYYKKDGKEYLENGKSKIRVTTMDQRPSPVTAGRILKFLAVNEVIAISPLNPIRHGSVLALSFPPEFINANDYEWFRDGRDEECQVAIKLKLTHAKHN